MDQQRLRELASQREESWAFVCFRYKTGANEITENPHSARKKRRREQKNVRNVERCQDIAVE